MTSWSTQAVVLRFQLSDWTFLKLSLPMRVRTESLFNDVPPVEDLTPPADAPVEDTAGYVIRSLPMANEHPALSRVGNYLCYIPLQYLHCYIDLGRSFEQYVEKFSSKTRSTIQRKIRKFKKHCGGTLSWTGYSSPDNMPEFFRLGREVSELTYQERLLDVGLPDTEAFRQEAIGLAEEDRVRAYILFDGDRPVSYLYCPVKDDVLIYAYLGYDPAYQKMSVGTVLQWLALEKLFEEERFRYFDFTEGQSAHKRLFATHQQLCANVMFVKRGPVNALMIYSHYFSDRFSTWLGSVLDRIGLKAKIKRLLRRA